MRERDSSVALRVGVAGLGFGAAVHVPALQEIPDVEVIGIAGRSREHAEPVAKRLNVPRACGSVEELLDLSPDAVTLALPPLQSAAAVRSAIGRGIPVLCEKPLGTNSDEAFMLAQMANGLTTAMDFQFSELETFIRLKEIVEKGVLGKPRHVQVVWLTESAAHRHRAWSWKLDRARGGGALALFGSHLFFLAEWLLGPAVSVWARTSAAVTLTFALPDADPAEDLVHCGIRHTSGAVFAATFGNSNPGATQHRWTVVCERGTVTLENLTADYMSGFVLTTNGDWMPRESVTEPKVKTDGRLPPFRRLAARFLNGVRCQQRVSPDLYAGARVQLIDASIRKSAADSAEQLLPIPS